jgi:hypothetical protein
MLKQAVRVTILVTLSFRPEQSGIGFLRSDLKFVRAVFVVRLRKAFTDSP